MTSHAFVTVDVFTDQRFGGNPLAVFPDATGLSDADMQALAAEFNLSETTFVLPPADPAHTARVRIFNRTAEMPFAGHPNVGTGYVLAQLGRDRQATLLFEEIAGLVEVKVARDAAGNVTGATIAAPQPLSLGQHLSPPDVASCAGLTPADVIVAAHPPMVASTGNPFVLAEIAGPALQRATPDLSAFRAVLSRTPALNGRLSLYLYARDDARIRARMFAPVAGTWEDAATGSAATPLAALLLSLTSHASAAFDIVQGVEMGRPSLLHATAHRATDGIRASVGGGCVPVLRGEATI
ncbi:MAG: PhzF family phenazine biosynthesis protein [Alphaproteobacteria bacterium]|nr:PhzF family phenazine biosynthesis protein [Alphaproteobacteria bacterium]